MTENIEQQSNWRTKLKALGPGILMASAAVGGSHIVSSTQAGAIYGWQLALVILLINIFKYPFFRFGSQYTMENDKSLIEGYAEKGKGWLAIFFVLNIFSAIVNTAGVGILCAAILYNIFSKWIRVKHFSINNNYHRDYLGNVVDWRLQIP